MRVGEDGRGGLGLYIGEGRASGSSGISSIPRASAGGFGSAAAGSSEREKREVGERADERGPPGSGSERRRARAARSGRPVRKASGAGAGLGPNGQWAGWPGALARRARPWAELVSVQAGECVRVFFFLQNTKVVIINSKELIKTPQ